MSIGTRSSLEENIMERQCDLMMEWLTGEFDNNYQVEEERSVKKPAELSHIRLHSIFAPVSLPEIGSRVLYVKQYMNDDPNQIYRERIYSIEARGQEICLRIWRPGTQVIRDMHLNEEVLDALDCKGLDEMKSCEVYWTFSEESGFRGSVRPGARFLSERSGKEMTIYGELTLTDYQLDLGETLEAVDGSLKMAPPGGVPYMLWKARPMRLFGFVRDDAGNYLRAQSEVSHDQGGVLHLKDQAGKDLGYSIKVEQLLYGIKEEKPILKFSIRRTSDGSLRYVWADSSTETIGLNAFPVEAGAVLIRGEE